MSVLIETTVGDLVVDLFVKERPRCCLNFIKLCKTKYYNFSMFHSIEENYIAQTGDPTNTGRGGQSLFGFLYGEQARYFEMETLPKLRHRRQGTVSMVDNGEGMHGSQFFLTLADELDFLDGKHTVFGQIAEGWDTIEKLNEAICDEQHRPYRDIRITHTIILDDPFDDPKGLDVPSRSPSPSIEILKSSRIGVDEEVDPTEGKTVDEIKEEIDIKESKARAHILEMVGDLHHAEEKPPDSVLFVCKLNGVTTEEDLEIIFGRFGKIVECEVIRDKVSGSSLQYAFIEFETPEQCESAYFKMDNVLIDDRRIHVDFSQSVAKNYQWKKQVGINGQKGVRDRDDKASKAKQEKRHHRHRSPETKKRRSRSKSPKGRDDRYDSRSYYKHKRQKSRSPRRHRR